MQWQVRYEPKTRQMPWNVYKVFDTEYVLEKGFNTEEEARAWADRKDNDIHNKDQVEEASVDSFPASDAPAWTKTTAGPGKTGKEKQR